jgi:RNA polymerase sigma-70 factor (ECF subfamily)
METSIRPEDWARATLALRRLAAELVRSPGEREELVQSTLVAALERPPRGLSWPWLAAVLRNRARDLARSRARHGRTAALPELASSVPESVEIAQRLELQEDLTRALRALAEPYQRTLYLRYFEDLTPEEIARRDGIPVKTVKTRLERGLALLRERLERRHGPGARALVLLLRPVPAPAGAPAASIPPALTAGGLVLMGKKIVVVAAALLCLVFLWRATRPAEGDTVAARPLEPVPAAVTEPADAVPALATPAALDTREATPVPPPSPERVVPRLGSLRVRVLGSDGSPAAGITVDFREVPPPCKYPKRGLTRAASDAEGWALASGLAPGRVSAQVSAQVGRGVSAQADVVAGEERELELRLAPGLEVEGRVLDEREGPVAGAEIWLTSSYIDWLGMSRVAVSDGAGRFRLRDVPGEQSLGATAVGYSPSELVDLELEEAHENKVEVVLRFSKEGGALEGFVVDARGAPASGAFVCLGTKRYGDVRPDRTFAEHWGPRLERCDEDGRFRFAGLARGTTSVEVKAAGAPLWSSTVEIQARLTSVLTVEVQDGTVLEGVVRDAGGAPVEHAYVRAFAEAVRPNFVLHGQYDDPSTIGSPITLADAQGRYRLEEVWPLEVHAYASPPRAEDDEHSEPHAEAVLHPVAGETLEWNPVLEKGRTIRGCVLFSDGEPMPGVFVSATEDGSSERRSLTTDDAGRFEFFNLPAGPFRVKVQILEPAGAAPLLEEGVLPDGAELELVADFPSDRTEPGAVVRGRFVDPGGRFPRPLAATLEFPGGSRWADSGEGGAFEFRGVRPGRYHLLGYFDREIGYVGEELELETGQELDLGTLEVPMGADLVVRLRRAPGLEQVEIRGSLRPAGGWIALDFGTKNELELPHLTRGRYVLELQGAAGVAQVRRTFELSGDMELEQPVLPGAPCRVEIEFAPEAARGTLHVLVTGENGATYEDSTYLRAWNERSPKVFGIALPAGRFTVRAETSSGFSAAGELRVDAPGAPPEPLRLVLR